MGTQIQVVIDCADPERLAHFWADALHYKIDDPPPGFDTWQDFLREQGVPEERWNDASAVTDPDGTGPRVFFQRVPEPKQGKNRLHLDLNAGGPRSTPDDERRRRIDAEVERLTAAGASVLRPGQAGQFGEYWVVLQDPEGNEFCVQ
jgi:hypothetical protein